MFFFGVCVWMKVAIPDPRSMGLTLQEELRQHIGSQDPCSKFQRNLGFLGPDLWIESTQKMIQLLWLSSNSKCQRVIMFLGFLEVFSHLRVNIVWCGQDWTRILFCFCWVFSYSNEWGYCSTEKDSPVQIPDWPWPGLHVVGPPTLFRPWCCLVCSLQTWL